MRFRVRLTAHAVALFRFREAAIEAARAFGLDDSTVEAIEGEA